MNKIDNALAEIRELDELAQSGSPIHELSPLAKFLTTIIYIVFTVSFNKYDLGGILLMAVYPIFIFQMSDTSFRTCLYKLRIVLPLVCAVGLFNPFFDKAPLLYVGTIAVSGGVISMITLMLKGVFCVTASYVLIATTPFDSICAALRKLHIPSFLVTLLLLTYRYISVMMEEISIMTDAYMLRAPGQKGIHISAWGSFLGQLLLRSMDRADELYQSMLLRGFDGEFYYAESKPWRIGSTAFILISIVYFVLVRFFDLQHILGSLIS